MDITDRVDVSILEPIRPDAGSAADEISAAAPGSRVVNAFTTTFAGTLVDGGVGGQPLDVLIAGDDEEPTSAVARLARDGGLTPVVAGPLRRAASWRRPATSTLRSPRVRARRPGRP